MQNACDALVSAEVAGTDPRLYWQKMQIPGTHWSLRWWLDAMPAASFRSESIAQYMAHSAVGNSPCSGAAFKPCDAAAVQQQRL